MILSLGQGQPSYVPDAAIGMAHDYADVSYLAFLQCYARDVAQWSVICYFAGHQHGWFTREDLAAELCEDGDCLAERLAGLAARHLLEERFLVTGPEYRLTQAPELRRLALRLGAEWRCAVTDAE